MSRFLDYAAQMRQTQTPFNGGAMPPLRTRTVFNPMATQGPEVPAQDQNVEQPIQQPQIDTSNAIGSLATMLGPTPAEREARERRMMENKSKMQAWTGLFDGLRQLGNLYTTAKGATPQQLGSPYQAIDQQYQQQRAIADANDQYARQYAQSLYNLRRQVNEDARKDILAKAQAEYYGTRDEMARQKAELDKLKAVKVIKQKDGSLMKYDPVTGAVEQLSEADPLYAEYMQSRINQTNKRTGLIGAPVTKTTNGPKGTTTSVTTYGRSGSTSKGRKQKKAAATTSKTYDNTKKLGL